MNDLFTREKEGWDRRNLLRWQSDQCGNENSKDFDVCLLQRSILFIDINYIIITLAP
jgi:hypothetical protein